MAKQTILSGRLSPGMSFCEKVWAVTSRIPKGRVVTYKQVAQALRCRSYRAVGMALGKNPYAPDVPCHRVVGSDGTLIGFAGGLPAKRKLLVAEGVPVENGRVDLKAFSTRI